MNLLLVSGAPGGRNTAKGGSARLKLGIGIGLLAAALTGCVAHVEPGYSGGVEVGGPVVVAPAPNVYYWGGPYEHGHDAYRYGHRGYTSRHYEHHEHHDDHHEHHD